MSPKHKACLYMLYRFTMRSLILQHVCLSQESTKREGLNLKFEKHLKTSLNLFTFIVFIINCLFTYNIAVQHLSPQILKFQHLLSASFQTFRSPWPFLRFFIHVQKVWNNSVNLNDFSHN